MVLTDDEKFVMRAIWQVCRDTGMTPAQAQDFERRVVEQIEHMHHLDATQVPGVAV